MLQVIIQVLIVGLLTGLVGIIWMIIRDTFEDDRAPNETRQGGSPSSEPRDGEKPHEPSSRQSKVAA